MTDMVRLTPDEIKALRLTHRGKKSLVVKRSEINLQPIDIASAIMAIPSLASRGFMTMDRLNDEGDFMAHITTSGEAALKEHGND